MTDNILKGISSLRKKPSGKSLYTFAKMYLPHYFKVKPSAAHKEIYELLEKIMKDRNKRVAIAAPRGFAKSTLISLFYIIYAICYQKEKFIVILSDTADQAIQILDNVKKELTDNEKFRIDFPEIFEKEGRPKPPRWTKSQIETLNGIKVHALGRGQKIRGTKYGKDRPTVIVIDDVETPDDTASETSMEKLRIWLTKSVLMAGDDDTNFIFMGTLYHPLCLLNEYLSPDHNKEWIKRVYKAIRTDPKNMSLWSKWSEIYNDRLDFEGKYGPDAAKAFYEANKAAMDEGIELLWPERWGYYDLAVMREDNHLSFSCEMQNEPYDPKSSVFNVSKFHYIEKTYDSVHDLLNARKDWLDFIGSCDPCVGNDISKGDYAAIIMVARDRENGRLYVVEADIHRRGPKETVSRIVDLCRIYKPSSFIIEVNNFQKLMQDDLQQQLDTEGLYMPIIGVDNRGDKDKRIHSLDSLIHRGTIQFSLSHKTLLDQFRFFPNGLHDDGPDALQMIVSNIEIAPHIWKNPVSITQRRTESRELHGIPDVRDVNYPQVHKEVKDRFVPDPNDY
jgi:predicted phage terminase large subunit-like protein